MGMPGIHELVIIVFVGGFNLALLALVIWLVVSIVKRKSKS